MKGRRGPMQAVLHKAHAGLLVLDRHMHDWPSPGIGEILPLRRYPTQRQTTSKAPPPPSDSNRTTLSMWGPTVADLACAPVLVVIWRYVVSDRQSAR